MVELFYGRFLAVGVHEGKDLGLVTFLPLQRPGFHLFPPWQWTMDCEI